MDFSEAQRDMRRGYMSGAAGVLASSLAWAAATASVYLLSPQQAVWVLFIGGALIHPAGLLIAKVLGAAANHTRGNPLAGLAGASTFWMILSLPLAYVASLQQIEWFFPAMLLIIGGRYLTFGTIYGMRLYWMLGFALAGAGIAMGVLSVQPLLSAATGSAIELVFAVVAFVLHARWAKQSA
ncbi:DUF7010 family protein [Terricaulis sp.]|uniref:DUF7010 family protein n=1 Tax=Terricaulis sp. TaxID=2768686 RepID=UPI002AC7AABF|nr:hypothetical protein [Terricaulis sp.]MDZ4693058.1 hypothetical protein [Terricaulis sp.]